MEKCDFLLTYETKNREMESLCALKWELERRGYTALIREQYAAFFAKPESVDAKVVVVPAYYRDRVRFYTASHTPLVNRVVNLQWEQVYAEFRGKKGSLQSIKPWGYDAMHISWGEDNRNRLINEYGVPENHVAVAGHMGMDFLRPELSGYYLARKEICERYAIPEEQEICLFISSFSATTSHDRFIEGAALTEQEKIATRESRDRAIASQREIIGWFDAFLSENGNVTFIYRPHPEERPGDIVQQMAEKYPNFRIISDISVKQWIVVSDKILTWTSTSIAEVYFSGKSCLILNPFPPPPNKRLKTYARASVISSRDAFLSKVSKPMDSFPIPEEDILRVYSIDRSRLSFELVCDVLERVINDDDLTLKDPLKNPLDGVFNVERIKCIIKRAVAASRICNYIRDKDLLKGTVFRKNIDDVIYVKEKLARNHISDSDVAEIVARLERALEGGDRK